MSTSFSSSPFLITNRPLSSFQYSRISLGWRLQIHIVNSNQTNLNDLLLKIRLRHMQDVLKFKKSNNTEFWRLTVILPQHISLVFAEKVCGIFHIYHVFYDGQVKVAEPGFSVDVFRSTGYCVYYNVEQCWMGLGLTKDVLKQLKLIKFLISLESFRTFIKTHRNICLWIFWYFQHPLIAYNFRVSVVFYDWSKLKWY